MQIKQLALGPFEANCYIVETDNSAVIIDPGYADNFLNDWVKENAEKVKYILLTHCHCDHITGAENLRNITGAPLCIGAEDADGYNNDRLNLVMHMGGAYPSTQGYNTPDRLLYDNDILPFGNLEIRCIHTPGHTIGGCCFVIGDAIFTGDTLFMGSVGRTDFYGGNFNVLRDSLKKIVDFAGDNEYTIYSGHGPSTIISHEKQENPYLVEL